jgi:Trypsin-co-occurring domain 1
MSQLVQLMAGDQPVLFEVRLPGEDVLATTVADHVIETTDKALDRVFALVSGMAESFSRAVRDTPASSSEIEFGLDLTGEGDLYVVSSSATASLHVKLSFGAASAS